ncbi:MAG TPA: glycosyltransferase [Longimicrobium sp.]|nr:glycosyltransferase [Longimicrobium sp.]
MATLPPNVTATFHGPVPPDRVEETLSRYHVFLLRTLSENFGHSIVEALWAGCPPLITDQTPWRGLAEANAGWDLPVDDVEGVRDALRHAVAMDDEEWRRWVEGPRNGPCSPMQQVRRSSPSCSMRWHASAHGRERVPPGPREGDDASATPATRWAMHAKRSARAPRTFPARGLSFYPGTPRPAPAGRVPPPQHAARPLRVLAFTEFFLPGFRAGGPVRALSNLARLLAPDVELAIVTRDRDFQQPDPYPGITADAWTEHAGIAMRYVSPRGRSLPALAALLRECEYDVLYLNSLWAPFSRKLLLLRRLRLIPDRPVVLAPRGELAAGALSLKSRKKNVYFAVARAAGLLDGLVWQATSALELRDVAARVPAGNPVLLARDPLQPMSPAPARRPPKAPGELRAVYLARVTESKNLLEAIEALGDVEGRIVFDVYGPVERPEYLARCQRAISQLPPNVTVDLRGPVHPDTVHDTLARYHLLLLPTRSENFGYSIVEAMRAGCPPLISDQTPWHGLAAVRAGWDVPAGDLGALQAALRQAVAMDDAEWRRWAEGTRAYARRSARTADSRGAFLSLLETAMERAGRRAPVRVAHPRPSHRRRAAAGAA